LRKVLEKKGLLKMTEDRLAHLTLYNRQADWNTHCAPVLQKLVDLCSIYEIPLFATACIRNSCDGSEYVADMVSPDVRDIILKDDHIPRHLAVLRGYDVHLPGQSSIAPRMEDMDEIYFE
jgi:hypothetical protein